MKELCGILSLMKRWEDGVELNTVYEEHAVKVKLSFAQVPEMYAVLEQYAHELESMYGVSFAWDREKKEISYGMTGIRYPQEEAKAKAFVQKWEKNLKELIEDF